MFRSQLPSCLQGLWRVLKNTVPDGRSLAAAMLLPVPSLQSQCFSPHIIHKVPRATLVLLLNDDWDCILLSIARANLQAHKSNALGIDHFGGRSSVDALPHTNSSSICRLYSKIQRGNARMIVFPTTLFPLRPTNDGICMYFLTTGFSKIDLRTGLVLAVCTCVSQKMVRSSGTLVKVDYSPRVLSRTNLVL